MPKSIIRRVGPQMTCIGLVRAKAAVNRTQSKRFARFQGCHYARSVWTARALAPLSNVVVLGYAKKRHQPGRTRGMMDINALKNSRPLAKLA